MNTTAFVNGLAAVLLTAGVVVAQTTPIGLQEADRARQLLNSSELANKAWGIYIAGLLRRDDLTQSLIEQFQFASGLSNAPLRSGERAFLAVLFDAAIESHIEVPPALLEPFIEKWTGPVLILLSRTRSSEDLLMSLRAEKSSDVVWVTANNLLWARGSKRWYAATLAEINITHRFIVSDSYDGEGSRSRVAGSAGAACGDGSASMPTGFPPVALYELGGSLNSGDVLLAEGPENVFYRRIVVPTDKTVGIASCRSIPDRMRLRIGYLAKLREESLEVTEQLFHSETKVTYTTIQNFGATVERSMKSQEQGIRAFFQHVEKFSYLGPPVPDLRLQIVPEIIDNRQKAAAPLPAVAPRDLALP